jgi:hypothetical protein
MEAIYSSETLADFNGLHGVVSQMLELFIITAVRTLNSIEAYQFIVEKISLAQLGLMRHILDVLGSNLGPQSSYNNRRVSWLSSASSLQCPNNI